MTGSVTIEAFSPFLLLAYCPLSLGVNIRVIGTYLIYLPLWPSECAYLLPSVRLLS